jgi:hypothetical protein
MSVTAVDAEKVSEFNVEITHLVTIGCSWTFCQGLENKIQNGWPALTAKALNIPVVNLGLPGVGNDNIHRRAYEYVYENLSTNSKPLFVIAWSQYWRREIWQKKLHLDSRFNDFAPIILKDINDINDPHEISVLESWNYCSFVLKTYEYKLSLINLFNSMRIPYLMTDYADNVCPEDDMEIFKKNYPGMYEYVNTDQFKIKDFYKLSELHPKLPCGHDGEESQVAVADYLVDQIKEKFSNYSFVNDKPFLTTKEMMMKSKYHRKFPEWCTFQL